MDPETIVPTTVPLVVDAIRSIEDHEMVRCAYYAIASDAPVLEANVQVDGTNRPFLFMQLEAIFLNPPDTQDQFDSIEAVDAMYEYAARYDGLFVDINDIWVPLTWFGYEDIRPSRLFRIAIDDFIHCWKFRNDQITIDVFLAESYSKRDGPSLYYSEEETAAFKAWTERQIALSREIYHQNRDNYLPKIAE